VCVCVYTYIQTYMYVHARPHTPCYVSIIKMGIECVAEKTVQVINWQMVRSLHVVARNTKLHNSYNIPISRKLWYLALMWSYWCRISWLLLYCVKCLSLWDHVTNCTVLGVRCIFFPPAVDTYDITFYVYWLQLYMCAEVEIHHLRWQYEIYRVSNLKSGVCSSNVC
jgi:hypothetical protein